MNCILHILHSLLTLSLFTVVLDLKALYLLLVKKGEESFKLGGRGIDVEFSFICKPLRVWS